MVINRILIEELESWFFGDVDALVAAYPGVAPTPAQKANTGTPMRSREEHGRPSNVCSKARATIAGDLQRYKRRAIEQSTWTQTEIGPRAFRCFVTRLSRAFIDRLAGDLPKSRPCQHC